MSRGVRMDSDQSFRSFLLLTYLLTYLLGGYRIMEYRTKEQKRLIDKRTD